MNVEHEFAVSQPPAAVWEFFQRVDDVVGCMPGAEFTGQRDDGSYEGRLSARLGPVKAMFAGVARIEADADAKTGRIEAEGVDREGGSTGRADVTYAVDAGDAGSGSLVRVSADLQLSGRLAQFGRPALVNEVSSRLIAEFVECLEAKLGAASEEEASAIEAGEVRGISLFFASLWSWTKKALGLRPKR